MKKIIVLLLLVSISLSALSQETIPAFQNGEWLRYRMSYSGFSNTLPLYPENTSANEQKNRQEIFGS